MLDSILQEIITIVLHTPGGFLNITFCFNCNMKDSSVYFMQGFKPISTRKVIQ